MAKVPLRVGLLIDSFYMYRWIHKIITDIRNSSIADVVLVIKDDAFDGKREYLVQKMWVQRKYWLYKAYTKLDAWMFKVQPDAFERVNIQELVTDCPTISVNPLLKKYSDYFSQEDVQTILEHQLDVALRFGFRILKGDVLRIAKYGIWSYHHGDNLVNRGGPPGFWEVMEKHSVTGSILQILTEDLDRGKVIYRSYSPTHKRSVKRNKNNYYWQSTAFVIRKLKDLYENGPSSLEDDPHNASYHAYSHRLYRNPANKEFLPILFKFCIRTLCGKLGELFSKKQWFLAYNFKPVDEIDDTFYRFKHILPPKDRYWADPFPVKNNGKYLLFIEEYSYKNKKGHISLLEMGEDGKYEKPIKILEKPYHLSYPFIFGWCGDYYMIPETSQNKTIELYRCVSFPMEWQLEKILMNEIRAVDTTLVEIDDFWWMFVNIGVEGTIRPLDELHLFFSDSPLGQWKAHRQNPVKSDCRSARPAGRLFRWNGDLYRPSQDCSVDYGCAISINKVDVLSSEYYRETEVSRILPKWKRGLFATHTLNHAGALTVMDGMLKVSKL